MRDLFGMTDAEKAEHARLGARVFARQGDKANEKAALELATRFDRKALKRKLIERGGQP